MCCVVLSASSPTDTIGAPLPGLKHFLPAAQGGGGVTDGREEKGEVKGRQWRREDRKEEKPDEKKEKVSARHWRDLWTESGQSVLGPGGSVVLGKPECGCLYSLD